jgi:hypothetical protein
MKALNHSLRVHILLLMAARRSLSPAEFQRTGVASLNKTAYHFRILRDEGVITLAETRKVRGATEHFYRLAIRSIAVRAFLVAIFAVKSREPDGASVASEVQRPSQVGVTIKAALPVAVDDRGIEELQSVISQVLPHALGQIGRRARLRAGYPNKKPLRHLKLAVEASGASEVDDTVDRISSIS